MSLVIEHELTNTLSEEIIKSSENKSSQNKQGNISLAERSELILSSLPQGSPFLIVGNADEVIKHKFREVITRNNLIRVNPESSSTLQHESFPLIIGNTVIDELVEALPQIHLLSQPFGDILLNIYAGKSGELIDEEQLDELMNETSFFVRGSNLRTDRNGENGRWEVDMMQTPKDLPCHRRSGQYTYRTGSNWEEFYY